MEEEDTKVDDAGIFNCLLLSFNWGDVVAAGADVLVVVVVVVVDFFLVLFRSTDMN